MGRCRFVTPGRVRIPLASVYVHRLAELKARKIPTKATKAEIDAAEQALAAAEADGEWIEVKTELNAGEAREVYTGMLIGDGVIPGEKAKFDPALMGVTKAIQYLLAWSLVDAQGEPAEISLTSLKLLDGETLTEVIEAVELHDDKVAAERAARKNVRAGGKASSLTSGSRSVPVGPSSASAH